jgi:hypothetical protein
MFISYMLQAGYRKDKFATFELRSSIQSWRPIRHCTWKGHVQKPVCSRAKTAKSTTNDKEDLEIFPCLFLSKMCSRDLFLFVLVEERGNQSLEYSRKLSLHIPFLEDLPPRPRPLLLALLFPFPFPPLRCWACCLLTSCCEDARSALRWKH